MYDGECRAGHWPRLEVLIDSCNVQEVWPDGAVDDRAPSDYLACSGWRGFGRQNGRRSDCAELLVDRSNVNVGEVRFRLCLTPVVPDVGQLDPNPAGRDRERRNGGNQRERLALPDNFPPCQAGAIGFCLGQKLLSRLVPGILRNQLSPHGEIEDQSPQPLNTVVADLLPAAASSAGLALDGAGPEVEIVADQAGDVSGHARPPRASERTVFN